MGNLIYKEARMKLKIRATFEDFVQHELDADRFKISRMKSPDGNAVYTMKDTKSDLEFTIEEIPFGKEPDTTAIKNAAIEKAKEILTQEYYFGKFYKKMSRKRIWGGSTMQTLLSGVAIKAAQAKPIDTPPTGMEYAYDPATDSWFLIKRASDMLDKTNFLEEFRHKLYRNPPKEITVGSTVYVKGLKCTAKIIRTIGDVYRADIDGKVISCWAQELEPLA